MLLVANGSVFTRNAQTPFIPNGAVAIDGDAIGEVGPERELKAKYPDAEYVDAQGNLIMPGLINCHPPIYSGLARGLAIKGCNPTNFLENHEQQWWELAATLRIPVAVGFKQRPRAMVDSLGRSRANSLVATETRYGRSRILFVAAHNDRL